jgi:hypothetical protein
MITSVRSLREMVRAELLRIDEAYRCNNPVWGPCGKYECLTCYPDESSDREIQDLSDAENYVSSLEAKMSALVDEMNSIDDDLSVGGMTPERDAAAKDRYNSLEAEYENLGAELLQARADVDLAKSRADNTRMMIASREPPEM